MPAVKLRVPQLDIPCYGEGTLSQLAKARLAEALADLTDWPAPVEPSTALVAEPVTIWLSKEQGERLAEIQRDFRFDGPGPMATALLHGWARAERESEESEPLPARELTTLDRLNAVLSNVTRESQAQFYERLSRELRATSQVPTVIAAEAATGLGKTRVFLAAMQDWSDAHPDEVAVLTAPSYNVLLQAVTLWHRLRGAGAALPEAVTLLGQQEYVSESAINRVLDEIGDGHPHAAIANDARTWLRAGAPPAPDDPLAHRWLLRGLHAATGGNWPYETITRLGPEAADDDAGLRAYRQQFEEARDAPWVFCTHAMLATDVRRRIIAARRAFKSAEGTTASSQAWAEWQAQQDRDQAGARLTELQNDLLRDAVAADSGRLPDIGLLVVDEAHLLEESFARVFTHGASMASMVRHLKALRAAMPAAVKAAEIAEVTDVWANLKAIGARTTSDQILAQESEAATYAISHVRALLKRVLARKLPTDAGLRSVLFQLKDMSRALELAAASNGARSGMTTRISFSPSEHWPSIEVGRYDVSAELDFLWTVLVRDRAVLVSATLYDDVTLQGLESTRRLLSIRHDRLRGAPPVRPPWTFEPVTLYLPADSVRPDSPRDQQRFYRPTERSTPDPVARALQTARWRQDIADYVVQAYGSGTGGMLVLLTSHEERQQLHQAIAGHIPDAALISQRPDLSLEAVRTLFLRSCADGIRPCLLAVGNAWTGLDLSGDALAAITGESVAAADDRVLTDLVIPNAPIGVNRTLTHQWRRARLGTVAEIAAVSVLFRQGIGRAVRREGLEPRSRRLHFLDARIYDPVWRPFFAPIRRALVPYTRTRFV